MQLVEVRGLEHRIPVSPDVSVALVVCHDEDDVWSCILHSH